jgi:hypothetical protein
MGLIRQLKHILRQLDYPPEFRIPLGGRDEASSIRALASILIELAAALRATERVAAHPLGACPDVLVQNGDAAAPAAGSALAAGSLAVKVPDPSQHDTSDPSPSPSSDLAIGIANACFRVTNSAKTLGDAAVEKDPSLARANRALHRSLTKLVDTIKEHGIQCVDVTNEIYDDTRTDFDAVGEPQRDPTLKHKVITFCERPVVIFHGKLVQRARGTLSIPA